MVKVIERILKRLLPELFSGYHLPMLAKVVAIADAPKDPNIVDAFRPRFAVDIQILTANGEVNKKLPVYHSVPLPVNMAGLDQGMWGFPQPGTTVEVAFAYGNPNKPFIRTVLSSELTTPEVNNGDLVWQHSPGIHQKVDSAGNWQRHTDKSIEDKSINRLVEALQDVQKYQQSTVTTATNSTEKVGATKTIEAMGAMKLTAGEEALLLALKDLKLASNKALRTYSKENTEIKTDQELNAIAKTLAHIEVTEGTCWFGSSDINAIQILVDLIGVVSAMADTLSKHTHPHGTPNTAVPVQASDFSGQKSDADALKADLEPITE